MSQTRNSNASSNSGSEQVRVSKLKDERNALFVKKEYEAASEMYTKAIAIDGTNAVLYANRAACRLNLRKYMDAISDAEEATKCNPMYAKAYARQASGYDALGQPWRSIEPWQKAIDTLPKDDSSPSVRQQKEQYAAGLDNARKALITSQNREGSGADTNAYIIPNGLLDTMPWNCAFRMIPELVRDGVFVSSAWVISTAYQEFEEGNNLMNTAAATVRNGVMMFNTMAITSISNAILTDSRVFHLTDPDWVSRYNQQVLAESQMFRAWTTAGPDVIKKDAVKRLQEEGWDVLRPTLSVTVRCWIMHGFIEGGFRANHKLNVEFSARAVEIIKWGRKEWEGVAKEDRGVIFEESFLRGVQVRHMEALMQLIKALSSGLVKEAMLEELLAEANEVLESVENNTMPPREDDPAFALAFWDYPKGQAFAMKGFYYAQKAVMKEEHYVDASLYYMHAAECYPEDDEQFTWYMIIAANNMMRSQAPVKLQLSVMELVRTSLPKVKRIWALSDTVRSGIDVKAPALKEVETSLRKLLDEGKVTKDTCVGTSYDGKIPKDGNVL